MKIYLNQIPETGFSATENLSALPYELDTEEVKIVSPLELSYRIFYEEENLFAQISISCKMRLLCSRCLVPYEFPFKKEAELTHPVGKAEVIDVTDDIRQEILLEYPIKPLCQDTCKGICERCGQNLNEKECECGIQRKV